MTRFVATLALATTIFAGSTGSALAQDSLDELRAHCATLEAVESPAVVDCAQAVADAEDADSAEDAQAIVDAYAAADSPYDFERNVTAYAEAGPTLFDAD